VRERGRTFGFGRLMTQGERARVAQALRRQIGRAAAGGAMQGGQWDSEIAR